MVGITPRRSAPASWSRPPRARSWILPTSSSTRRACSTMARPRGVPITSFLLRSKRFMPSSSSHLPRYNELAPTFRKAGVDEIVVISVNDAFVMSEWQKDQNAPNVTFLPDGNGEFTAAMGMLVDKSNLGFGKRSWRYSMLVKDGVVQKIFSEPDKPGDPYEVSDADTMLDYINPNAKRPDQVAIFTREGCSFCARAKELLTQMGYDYAEVPLPHTIRTRVV